jgi:glycosyltransferase involved in cell wall biosynthesis
MKILIFNHYAGNKELGMEFRPYFLAKVWIKLGHQVTIVGSSYSHVRGSQPKIKGLISEENVEGIKYIWLYGMPYIGSGIKRAVNIIQYLILSCILLPKKINHDFDVIINSSTYPLDIFSALFIKRFSKNALLVFEPHDLWPMALTELGGMSHMHPFVLANSFAEKISCKASDIIISMHPGNIEHLKTKGAKIEDFYHVPNGVNLDDWGVNDNIKSSLRSKINLIKNNGEAIIMYVGSLSLANDLDFLLQASTEIKNKAQFIIVGDGPERDRLEILAQEKDLPFHFLGHIPKAEVPDTLSQADICFVGFQFNPLYKYGMSANKLWDYMMSAKPIVMSIASCNDPVAEADCGITVSTGKQKDLAKAFDKILNLSLPERNILGKNGFKYVVKNNSYDVLGRGCIAIFEKNIKKSKI